MRYIVNLTIALHRSETTRYLKTAEEIIDAMGKTAQSGIIGVKNLRVLSSLEPSEDQEAGETFALQADVISETDTEALEVATNALIKPLAKAMGAQTAYFPTVLEWVY